jgi:hypothetical protein
LFQLKVDGEKFAGEFLFVEVLNLSYTGPALPLAFHASPDDGMFDVVFLEAKNRKLKGPGEFAPVTSCRGLSDVLLFESHGRAARCMLKSASDSEGGLQNGKRSV